jgi:hypothetical protein
LPGGKAGSRTAAFDQPRPDRSAPMPGCQRVIGRSPRPRSLTSAPARLLGAHCEAPQVARENTEGRTEGRGDRESRPLRW